MSTLNANNPTLLDLAKRMDPDGTMAAIAEILNQDNEILQDMTWQEGNLITGNRSTIRTGIPMPTWFKLYGYIQPTKSTTTQVDDRCGLLGAYSMIDCKLADLNNNAAAWRMSEDKPIIEGFAESVASALFYGNEATNPAAFTGLSPRFNDSTANNGRNIIKGHGVSTDNASMWLVYHSSDTMFGIVPKGSKAGLQMKDLGEQTDVAVDGSGGLRQVYRTHYTWDLGLTVKDWRGIVRGCNIDKALLGPDFAATGYTGENLPDMLFRMIDAVPNSAAKGRPAIYMCRQLMTALRQQLANGVKQSTLEVENVGGVITTKFQGIPLRRVDVLAADEALVV